MATENLSTQATEGNSPKRKMYYSPDETVWKLKFLAFAVGQLARDENRDLHGDHFLGAERLIYDLAHAMEEGD